MARLNGLELKLPPTPEEKVQATLDPEAQAKMERAMERAIQRKGLVRREICPT